MNDCIIKIIFPKKILKGAGTKHSSFLPAWIYKIQIIIENNSDLFKLSSLNSTFGNGFTYLGNLNVEGPDSDIEKYLKIVEPNNDIGNNNLIIFANNFKISPFSKNIISFDIAVNNNYTKSCLENSGDKILHKTKLNINAYLLSDGQLSSDNCSCDCMDYLVDIHSDDKTLKTGDETKIYVNCSVGQYDAIRKVYLKCTLDSGLSFIDNTSNINPDNFYISNNRTILRWNFNYLFPSESKRIGFKVLLSNKYRDNKEIKQGDRIINSFNSNGANNTTYTQVPDTVKLTYTVV